MRFKLNNFNPIVISYNFYFSLFYLLFPIVISYNLYYTMKKLWYDTPTYTYTYMQTSNARMAKNNKSRKLCYIEALCEFKNNKINKKK